MTASPDPPSSSAGSPPPHQQPPKGHTRLPPGLVLGPDGKPCRACNSLSSMRLATRSFGQAGGSKAVTSAGVAEGAGAAAVGSGAAGAFGMLSTPAQDCPPDSEQLGRATWTFLHTAAAYYPEHPSPAQQTQMSNLLHSLPTLYPCHYCALHLGKEIDRRGVDVSGREGVSRWLCEVHNEVNQRLGKVQFDCSKVLERWKTGPAEGSCD